MFPEDSPILLSLKKFLLTGPQLVNVEYNQKKFSKFHTKTPTKSYERKKLNVFKLLGLRIPRFSFLFHLITL